MLLAPLSICALGGCTAVDYVATPPKTAQGAIFFTAESVAPPYESLGVIQLTRKGALLFGFADPAGTDLETALHELEPKVRAAGADGVVNLRFSVTPHTPAEQVIGAIFFFAPIGSQVIVSGEMVRLRAKGTPGGAT
jgi:hypothetical protein